MDEEDELPPYFYRTFIFNIVPYGSQMDSDEVSICRDYGDSDTGKLVCELLTSIGDHDWERASQVLESILKQENH